MPGGLVVHQEIEIIGRGNQSLSKMFLPYTVYDHAGGQRIIRRGDPVSQGQTATRSTMFGLLDFRRG